MFALEIQFQDGAKETILVKRPLFRIGSHASSHVIINDMSTIDYQLQIARDLGRQFRCYKVKNEEATEQGLFENNAKFDLGVVKFSIVAIDNDLLIRETEPPDRAGVRVLRYATINKQPKFPALLILGKPQLVISFDKSYPVYLGRSKQCSVRLDNPDISGQHARIGFENSKFWVEDLGSTNGTFVNQQQISGRVEVAPVVPIVLGEELSVMGIISETQLRSVERSALGVIRTRPQTERKYPVLLSTSEVARPARLVIPAVGTVQIGRDPTSDLWLGEPRVSRSHCSISINDYGQVVVVDQSTNGTRYDQGVLRKGESLIVQNELTVFDFGGGVNAAICFDESQEQEYIENQGVKNSYNDSQGQGHALINEDVNSIINETDKPFEESLKIDDKKRQRKPTGTFQALHIAYGRSGRRGKLIILLVFLALFTLILFGLVLIRGIF